MIGSLRGVLLDRHPRGDHSVEVLLEVGGVGYRVVVPAGAAGRLGELGATGFLHVHTHVREDAIVLYGFPSREERSCFEALIGAHGVGPAVGLAMLSVHSPAALRRAVATDDLDALALVPGIGKKTAARLVVELKARLDVDGDTPDLVAVGGAPSDGGAMVANRRQVRAALAGLGYAADEIRGAIAELPEDGSVEELVRSALRQLSVGQ
ncbi:MAG: Holliday junction branch migration protein RuvA [Acidimicrobiaceae bacterium]|nr:Holliday junction branch migration protein RuvA [Acidimicrobiaceae bacterium]